MYIARIDGVFDEYFYDKFIWDEPSEVKKYLMSMIDVVRCQRMSLADG